jgi:hypothetical protein
VVCVLTLIVEKELAMEEEIKELFGNSELHVA